MEKETKDFLIRSIPAELAQKMKTAASLHGVSLKDYLIQLFEDHLKGLEAKGLSLSLDKKRKK